MYETIQEHPNILGGGNMLKDRLKGAIVRNLMWKKAPYYLCRYYDGKLICPPLFARWMVRVSVWEPESRAYFENNVQRGDVAIDVGAGIGHYTYLFSKLVGEDGHVIAYEPDPYMFKLLTANIKINQLQNVHAVMAAVGDSTGKVPFYIGSVGASSLLPMRGVRSIVEVDIQTLDSFDLPRLDWLKIDTEGTESSVLRGARRTIARCNPQLLVEFIPEIGPVHEILAELEGWDIKGLDSNILCYRKTSSHNDDSH